MVRPGVFAFAKHNPTLLFDQIGRLQPSAIKAFVHLTDDGFWQEVKRRAPNAYGVVVDGERSDYPSMENPEADAEAGARELDRCPSAPRRIMGKNERLLSTNSPDYFKMWTDYHIRYTVRAHQLGFNVAMGALNTGHPGVALFGDPVDQWPMLAALDQAMNSGDCWDLHSYWNSQGPLGCWPWTAGRFLRCPTSHKILIGECGYDDAVFSSRPNHGWAGHLTADTYVSQLLDYHRSINDSRVVGTAIFLLDYDNPHWAGWDVTPLIDRLIERIGELAIPAFEMPKRMPMPVPQYIRISQTFAEHKAANKLGGWGLDFSCYIGTPVRTVADGVVDRVENQGDAGYGNFIQVNHYWGFTRYAHLSACHVAKGDMVRATQQIGLSGNSGNSTGPHLHFEIIPFDNRVWPYRVDPAPFFGLGGVVVPTPTPEPIPPATITEQEKAAGRARIGDVAFLDKAATQLGLAWSGIEWADNGYTYGIAQKFNSDIFYLLKAPTGQWDFAKVLSARL